MEFWVEKQQKGCSLNKSQVTNNLLTTVKTVNCQLSTVSTWTEPRTVFALRLLPDHLPVGEVRDAPAVSVQPGPAAVTLDPLLTVPHLLTTHPAHPVTQHLQLSTVQAGAGVGRYVLEYIAIQTGRHSLLVLN